MRFALLLGLCLFQAVMAVEPTHVLDYWFGTTQVAIPQERVELWFYKSEATDNEIRERFGDAVEQALNHQLDHWSKTDDGRLALILLLDQFTRNIYRGTPKAFAGDAQAEKLALEGIANGFDQRLVPARRLFTYFPLEHAEDRALQQQSVTLFGALADTVGEEARPSYTSFLKYAERHRVIVDRFGRFPHRNEILGRPTTAEEGKFLTQPGSRF